MTTQPTAGVNVHTFNVETDPTGDAITYVAVSSPSQHGGMVHAKYKVTRDHHNRQDGRVADDYTVAYWTPNGWQTVMTFKDGPRTSPDTPNQHPADSEDAAVSVHRFLHHEPTTGTTNA